MILWAVALLANSFENEWFYEGIRCATAPRANTKTSNRIEIYCTNCRVSSCSDRTLHPNLQTIRSVRTALPLHNCRHWSAGPDRPWDVIHGLVIRYRLLADEAFGRYIRRSRYRGLPAVLLATELNDDPVFSWRVERERRSRKGEVRGMKGRWRWTDGDGRGDVLHTLTYVHLLYSLPRASLKTLNAQYSDGLLCVEVNRRTVPNALSS